MKAPKLTVGWREWVGLPALGVEAIKVKVDTGALTSALHAIHVRVVRNNGRERVRFDLHPLQRDSRLTVHCEADLLEWREVRSSNGDTEFRPVIRTPVALGGQQWPIDVTLTNRDSMGFRMLLGRRALRRRLLVDPGVSYLFGDHHPTAVTR
ncbi:MAG: ATP-dependent zinc protease [Ectothiorhodospiraceae bacterium]|nr:ATP-dependent zinc protease [Ectothiorhodospiraceae bacterium]MCH8504522.1 RimK/LysX family protein [Ectothiorhodospiraceae bacterium]